MNKVTKTELMNICKKYSLKGYSKYNKNELIKFLQKENILSNDNEILREKIDKNIEINDEKFAKSLENLNIKDTNFNYFKIEIVSSNITKLRSNNYTDIELEDDCKKINGTGEIDNNGASASYYLKLPKNKTEKILNSIEKKYFNNNDDIDIQEETSINSITKSFYQNEIRINIIKNKSFNDFFN